MPHPITFVLGAPRSGTTLFRVMLAGHPGLWSPPEMVLAPFATMAERKAVLEARFWEKGGLARALMDLLQTDVEGARAAATELEPLTIPEVYAWLQARLGERILVDKCPHLSVMPESMTRLLDWFPDARFLWIIRHPAAVTRSLQNMPMAEVMLQGYPVPPGEVWRYANENIANFLATVPQERWMRLRYEDLVREPQAVMEQVCATAGVAFDAAVLNPYEGDRMREGPRGARAIGDPNMAGHGAIRPELADKWLDSYDPRSASPETRGFARAQGYDLDAMPLPPLARMSDSFGSLLSTTRALEQQIELPMELDATEGRRFLLRVLAESLDTFVEFADTDRPSFRHAEGPTRKMFADNPDADYLRAPIRTDGEQVYRVWGQIPAGTCYVGVLLYGRGGRIGRRLTDADLALDAEGRFELRISRQPQKGVWLQADGDETAVMVRQYFGDRAQETPITVHIAREGAISAPAPLDPTTLMGQLGRAERMVKVVWDRTLQTWKMASAVALNKFIQVPGEGLFPTPDNDYRVMWYRFGQDQLMFVRGVVPQARYFSFTLYNAWMESLDYTRHRVNLNHTALQTDADGRFELCLGHADPGHPNFLDVAGHGAGYLLLRTLLAREALPELQIQVLYRREWPGLSPGSSSSRG